MRAQRLPLLLIVGALLLSMASPLAMATGGREAAVSLSADSMSKEAKPGEPADYTITVSNDGSDDITVSLSTQEGQDCQGFSSTIEQIPSTISSGSSEDVTMTVNVTQGADGDCETTVRVSAQVAPPGAPGAPAQDEITVTTTVGEGGGSGAFSISLTSPMESKTYAGEDFVEYVVDVENTGQTQATVELTLDSDSECRSDGLSATIDPSQVNVAAGSTESVDVQIEIQSAKDTKAGEHCFIVRGVVSNDPNPDRASDNLSLILTVPEIHDCESSLHLGGAGSTPVTAVDLDPGDSVMMEMWLENYGNSAWTVNFASGGSKSSWVDISGPSSKQLPYDGITNFEFSVTADASIEAGESTSISLQAKDGSVAKCSVDLTVTLGQSHDGTLTLSQSSISKLQPGTSHTIDVTVRNTGNGVDSFDLTAMTLIDRTGENIVAEGWTATFSNSSIRLESYLADSGDAGAVQLTITAPTDAIADEGIRVPITLYGSDAESIVSVNLFITVAEVYDFSVVLATNDTTGGSYQTVSFPVTISNDGNIADTYRLDACDGSNPLSCDEPGWPAALTDEAGTQLSQISVAAGETVEVFLDVSLQATREAANKRLDVRVTSLGSPSIVLRESVTARVSIYSYEMAIGLVNPGDEVDSVDIVLPPTGTTSIDLWIENIGNSSYADKAVITVTGLEDFIDRRIIFNGSETNDHIPMPRPGGGERVMITIEFSISEAAENGAAGTIQIGAASYKNPTDRNTIPALFTIRTVHDLSVEVVGGSTTVETVYPRSASFLLRITNSGNIAEDVEVFTSEGLRGWTVDVETPSFALEPGESREMRVVAKPPSALDTEDRFQFTVVAQPEGQAASAQPLDLVAVATPAGGLLQTLGLSDQQQTYVSYGAFAAIGLLILGLLIRSRRDAESIREAIEEPRKSR